MQTTQEYEINKEMEELLSQEDIHIPQIGEAVEGVVIEKNAGSLLIDLGSLGTGIVFGIELKDGMGISNALKPGDTVKSVLVEFENEDGYVELSIRQASYEKAWEDIEDKKKSKTNIPTKILDANKGGLIVEVNGITGFLPVSQLSSKNYPRVENGDKNKILELLKRLVGQELPVRVLDCHREDEKLIVSEKLAQSERELTSISELKVGDILSGEVSGVVDFGAFVKFLPPSKKESAEQEDRIEGLVHISELAWQLIDDPREIVKTGDKVQAKIIGIDATRISLSFKALKKDPWTEVEEKYHVGDIVEGKVDKINPFGAFVYLDSNIHGLAHVSEFKEVYNNKTMEEVLKPGETYQWRILSIEPKEHRMGLVIVKK